MTDIENTQYITLKQDGIFVGGKPTNRYAGETIENIPNALTSFATLQKQHPDVKELHMLASDTCWCHGYYGDPSTMFGPNAWCRVVFNDDITGRWVLNRRFNSAPECARLGLSDCVNFVLPYPYGSYGQAVLNKSAALVQALEENDVSKFDGKSVKLNGYEIVVRKLAETQQNKR